MRKLLGSMIIILIKVHFQSMEMCSFKLYLPDMDMTLASGTISTYLGTLQDTFYGFKEIRFENEDGTTVEFDQVGEPSKPMKLNSGVNYYNYYLFKQ